MPLIFAIGVALGFTNNDGVSALAAVVAYGIMVKTMAVVAPLVLHLPAEEIAAKHLADTGVLGGIISGAIAAYMFNRFYRIKLPEYLGFFAGKRFVPIISGLAAIFTGVVLSFVWPPIGTAIGHSRSGRLTRTRLWRLVFTVSSSAARCRLVCTISGTFLSRCRSANTPTQRAVFHGDIPRYMAGDPTAGMLSGGFLFKMYGLPAAAIAIWHSAKPENRAKVGGIMISAALTSF